MSEIPVCGEEAVARVIDPYGWQLVDEARDAGRTNPERARAAEIYLAGRGDSLRIAQAAMAAHTAALREAGLLREWLSIETAPRDGTWFLGGWRFQGEWVYRLGRWNQYHKTFNQVPGYHSGPFSHWQPLPAAPPYPPNQGS